MPPKKAAETKTAETSEGDAKTSQDVAIFSPPRIPFHPAIEERFGVDRGQWKVLVEAIYPAAKTADSIAMVLTYCKSRGLDPFKRVAHIVPMWDSGRGTMVETVWPGISELRTTASRTKEYAGCDEAQFGDSITMTFTGRIKDRGEWKESKIEVEFPEWCRITVYRIVNGQTRKFVGPKVVWLESYATQGASELPNKMWQERPEGQLEKCAEAAALRRAFPEEIGNELTAEEMIGRNVNDLSVDMPAATTEASAAPNKDAGPPRQVAPTNEPEVPAALKPDPEQARDGTPPPRDPKPAPKEDPISTGGPPRAAPKAKDDGPSDPGPQPHRIPGTNHNFESWSAKYCDLIKTSPDLATLYKWIDCNSREFSEPNDAPDTPKRPGPLNRVQKGKPSAYATIKKTTEELVERFRDEQAKAAARVKKKAEPPPSEMDDAGTDDMMDTGDAPDAGPPDTTDPEAILKWAKERLATVTEADALEAFYNEHIDPHIDRLMPPDRDEVMAEYRRTEKRLGID